MIAHLSNVKSNMAYSNGNGTEDKITAIDEKIRLLEVEREQVANASSQEEFVVIVRSVCGWNNAEKTSLEGVGQTVSEKIGEFLEKSENLSEKLGARIDNLNKTGVDTTDLNAKPASYDSYIKSAQENKDLADSIYSSENVTKEDMEKGNNYLRQSLSDIDKANDIIRQILYELEEHETDKSSETGVESNQKTSVNNTENITVTNSSNTTTGNPESGENVSSEKEKIDRSQNDTENLTEELHN